MEERDIYQILNALKEIGPITTASIREALGERFNNLFELSDRELLQIRKVTPAVLRSLRSWQTQFDLQLERKRMQRAGVFFYHQNDPYYPAPLRNLPDPPLGLYWKGKKHFQAPAVAIIGTRNSSSYGDRIARELAMELARNGFSVVSGLAKGIDTAAHWGALDGGGQTFAVLGHGIERLYPRENKELRDKIIQHGAVMSEFPFARRADRQTFPMRNRLVSGMSDALVVVETDLRGGSMITANFAADQGKTLFAVPGNLGQLNSRGCHALIRDGAILLSSVDDLLEELGFLKQMRLEREDKSFLGESRGLLEENSERVGVTKDVQQKSVVKPCEPPSVSLSSTSTFLTEDAQQLLRKWRPGERINVEQWIKRSEWEVPRVQTALLMLELERIIYKAVDGFYELR